MNFAIIGNDKRMDYVAEELYSLGCEVSRDLNKLNAGTNLIISPPVTAEYYVYLEPYASKINRIYGGCITSGFKEKFGNSFEEIQVIDYLSFENVISENAKLTALGIIKEALLHKACLEDSQILVTGYGYCGKAIAIALREFNAHITVSVRNHKCRNEILEEGFDYMDIKNLDNKNLSNFDYIFNTVPAMIFHRQVLDNLKDTVMIFDIASKPGGVDFDYCLQKGIFALLSLGIPGKEYPKEAGALIGTACFNHYISL